jgi:hypothetical protein
MGIQGSSQLLYRSIDLEFQHVVSVIEDRYRVAKLDTTTTTDGGAGGGRQRPCIAIDANQIGYTHATGPFGAVNAVTFLGEHFARNGIDVIVVCDGPDRHHSKRASVLREGERERCRIQLNQHRTELTRMILQDKTDSTGDSRRKRIEVLQKKIRSLETKSKKRLPEEFTSRLEDFAA